MSIDRGQLIVILKAQVFEHRAGLYLRESKARYLAILHLRGRVNLLKQLLGVAERRLDLLALDRIVVVARFFDVDVGHFVIVTVFVILVPVCARLLYATSSCSRVAPSYATPCSRQRLRLWDFDSGRQIISR